MQPFVSQSVPYRLRIIASTALACALMAFSMWLSDSTPRLAVPDHVIQGDPAALRSRDEGRRPEGAAVLWPIEGGSGGDHYSGLAEITRANVESLRVAWIYRTGDVSDGVKEGSGPSTAFESTPLFVNGLLYLATPSARVVALDPERGTERWAFDAHLDRASLTHDEVTVRGVAAWIDSTRTHGAPCRTRIFLGTFDARLIALDGDTGQPCGDFGAAGAVDLHVGVRGAETHAHEYHVTSPPIVVGDVVIVGSSIFDNIRIDAPSGSVRAYDVRDGRLRWAWEPLVRYRGEAALHPAGNDGFRSGAANSWGLFTADPAHDVVFIPTGSASPDHFGGLRPGDDRDANSIVALRASTGQEIWAFQLVHHDLWDYDVAAQPALTTVVRNGVAVPAVVEASKTGMVFVLDRLTGRPLLPVDERPVPASDVPGELASPTQPFPTFPPPVTPQGLRPDDAWGLTPVDRSACAERIRSLRSQGIFTPPSMRGSVVNPGFLGGVNWGGVAVDSLHGLVVLNTIRVATVVTLLPRTPTDAQRRGGQDADVAPDIGAPYGSRRELLRSPLGLPCSPPPWGTLIAIDPSAGRIRWQVPIGTMSDYAHIPAPAAWGSPSLGGPLVTAGGVVFIAAAMDHDLRAYDVQSGRELWAAALPASAQASPMTYRARPDGRQYVVIAAGGHHLMRTRLGDYLVAFVLR
ncbi:MAG TPA: pyrroloquinoline quinone-dependent dehydrogenase [Gemmatimonadaceae bacterium]|nr:pyrroloquinoline quinone-dependent dehydrogenase [Gemmatimonadaceae bacterium]